MSQLSRIRRPAPGARPDEPTKRPAGTEIPPGVQAKLSVGSVDDPLEADADRVADQVMEHISRSVDDESADQVSARSGLGSLATRIRRAPSATLNPVPEVGADGGEVSDGLAARLRRSTGKGRALDEGTKSTMESAFGNDFSSVRVHADSDLAPSMGAEAFTHGNDIHFAPGRFRPENTGGQRLLSHELAHVVQQNGPVARKAISRQADGVEVPAEVQRDRSPGVIRAKFGDKIKEKAKGAVKAVKKGAKKVKDGVGAIKEKVNTVFGKASAQPDAETGNDVYDAKSHDRKISDLRKVRGSGPGENPDYSNVAVWGQEPDKFVVSLAVAQENPSWMKNVNDLKSVALKEIVGSPKKLLGDLPGAQARLVQKTLLSQGKLEGKDEAEIKQLVEKFTDGIHDVGHTWVRMSTYVGGTLKDLYSYGMWPQKMYDPQSQDTSGGYAGFVSAGPGEIRHPDNAHEQDSMKAYKDYTVKAASFDKALDLAIKYYNSPPPYVLTGYNCTAFAKEIVEAGGGKYPGKGILPGFAYTPGDLYWVIMKEWAKGKKGVHTNDEQTADAVKKGAKRQEAFQESGEKAVVDDYEAETEGMPDDSADRVIRKIQGGNVLVYGDELPNKTNKTMKIDNDLEVSVIDDEDFIDRWKVIPLDFGPKTLFVTENTFNKAAVPLKPKKPKPTGGTAAPQATAKKVSIYNGTWDPPGNDAKPISEWNPSQLMMVLPDRVIGGWTEIRELRTGDIFWVATNDYAEATGEVPKPTTANDTYSDETSSDSDSESEMEVPEEFEDQPPTQEELDQMALDIADVLVTFAGTDLGTLSIILDTGKGFSDLTGDHVRFALVGQGSKNRAKVIAAALECSIAELFSWFGPGGGDHADESDIDDHTESEIDDTPTKEPTKEELDQECDRILRAIASFSGGGEVVLGMFGSAIRSVAEEDFLRILRGDGADARIARVEDFLELSRGDLKSWYRL